MNTLEVEKKLADKYGYKKLPDDLSKKYRRYFYENIPSFLSMTGGGKLLTLKGTLICDSYYRIVIGDYGAFIEYFDPATEYAVAKGQEYRITDPYYSGRVKYEWYTINDGSGIKIYKQKRGVTYADYMPGRYYVSVHEVMDGEDYGDRIH